MKALDKCCCDFTTLPADGESWILWNLWGGYTASTPEIPKETESVHWESTWRGGNSFKSGGAWQGIYQRGRR
jgi:hypothetical protein